MQISQPAPAKINLALHITDQRQDGMHLLDSLVAFAAYGDHVTVEKQSHLSLDIHGEMAADLPVDDDNLVLRAARLMGVLGAKITLEKNLPIASGIGGGSSDAAAVMRALSMLWDKPIPTDQLVKLGADIPVCIEMLPARMRGVGEELDVIQTMPRFHAVLVNPNIGVSTAQVFNRITSKQNAPLEDVPDKPDYQTWLNYLQAQRNDMQDAAIALCPAISKILEKLSDADLARMSGSGATCFGIYKDADQAAIAAERIKDAHPEWWVMPTILNASD